MVSFRGHRSPGFGAARSARRRLDRIVSVSVRLARLLCEFIVKRVTPASTRRGSDAPTWIRSPIRSRTIVRLYFVPRRKPSKRRELGSANRPETSTRSAKTALAPSRIRPVSVLDPFGWCPSQVRGDACDRIRSIGRRVLTVHRVPVTSSATPIRSPGAAEPAIVIQSASPATTPAPVRNA